MQVDQELATGEFFLRESVKKRKKMEEIKVSIYGGFVSSSGCFRVSVAATKRCVTSPL